MTWVVVAFSALSSLRVRQIKDVRGEAGFVPVSPPGYSLSPGLSPKAGRSAVVGNAALLASSSLLRGDSV